MHSALTNAVLVSSGIVIMFVCILSVNKTFKHSYDRNKLMKPAFQASVYDFIYLSLSINWEMETKSESICP